MVADIAQILLTPVGATGASALQQEDAEVADARWVRENELHNLGVFAARAQTLS